MRANDVLRMQLNGSFGQVRDRLESMTDQEWTARALPDTSKPGFIVWHATRIIDWGVHCAIQGAAELADRPEWQDMHAADLAYGAGITASEADQVTESTGRDRVGAYLAALQPVALAWLDRQTDSDLERVPEFEANQRVKPRYVSPPVWAEVSDFVGLPAWHILARPCISHIRVHMGEVDTLLQAIRAKAPA
jgi:DinB superfamily